MTDSRCADCYGRGGYWTEWSDRADADADLVERIIERPDPPDGTVYLRCACRS